MCCGHQQYELPIHETVPESAMKIQYSGQPQVYVRGAITRTLYPFSASQPVQAVDPRDAQPLLATQLFRLCQ